MIKKFTVAILASTAALVSEASNIVEVNDSVQTITEEPIKKEKNLKFSILGGPGYTPDYGVLIGGSALLTFSTDPADKTLQRSVMPIAFGLTLSSNIGFNLSVRPQLFFNQDKMRLYGNFIYKNIVDNYYGIGYATNRNTIRGAETEYLTNSIQINPVLTFRIPQTNFFMGPTVDFIHERVKKPGLGVQSDPYYMTQGGDSTGLTIRSSGLGFVSSYDTRDVAANAYKGVYFEMKTYYYSKAFGSQYNFGSLNLDYRQYVSLPALGERRVLAWNVNSKNVFGNIPFTRYSLLGSPFDLRGYYQGHYRDKSALSSIVEYRHMFNFGDDTRARRFWSRFGFATWGGVGFLGTNPVRYEAVLPNFGAGLRIELQKRMNFRLDIGRSPIDKQTLIYFNMTESF